MYVRKGALLNPTQAKILYYLSPLSSLTASYLQPGMVTQEGISKAIGVARNHVSFAVNRLIAGGYIESRKSRVENSQRKKTCYFLTPDGQRISGELSAPARAGSKIPDAPDPHFTGRNKEMKALSEWLQGRQPVFGITAERGMGKMTLATQFLHMVETERSTFYWSLRYDGSLAKGLGKLGESLQHPAGKLLSYLIRAEQLDRLEKLVRVLDEVEPPLLLALNDSGIRCEEISNFARSFSEAKRAKLLLISEVDGFLSDSPFGRLRLAPLSEGESRKLAKRVGYPSPGRAYETSGGKPSLITMWRRGIGQGNGACRLGREEAGALLLLSAFGRPVHVGEAASAGIDYQTVTNLVDKNLVELVNEYVHPLIKPEHLSASARRRARVKVARALLAVWPDPDHALEACRHYSEAGEAGECAAVLREKGEAMIKAGIRSDVESLVRSLDTDAIRGEDRARLLVLLGGIAKLDGRWDEALANFGEAVKLGMDDKAFVAETTSRIASVYLAKRELVRARELYESAERKLPRGSPSIEARIHDELATLFMRLGDMASAARHSARAVALSKESGGGELAALCEATAGNLAMLQDNATEAEAHFQNALSALRRNVKNVRVEGTILNNLAALKLRQGKTPEAIEYLKESVRVFEQYGDKRYCMASANLALAMWRCGNWADACIACERAMSAAELMGDREVIAACLSVQAQDAFYRGRADDAKALFQNAIEIVSSLPDRDALARARTELADVWISSKRAKEASELMDEEVKWAEGHAGSEEAATVLHQAARARIVSGDVGAADELLKKAVPLLKESDHRRRAKIYRMMGAVASGKGDWYIATRYLEDSIAIFRKLGEGPDAAVSMYDLAKVLEHFSLRGAGERMEEARSALEAIGAAFPPPASDWALSEHSP